MKKLHVLDCTIRDGGIVNQWDFSSEFVRDVYAALSAAGIEYMEIGYKNSPEIVGGDGIGPWRFCDEQLLKQTIPHKTATKLSAVVDVGRCKEEDILPAADSVLDLIRVACYNHQMDEATALIRHLHEKGYETSVNIMGVSTVARTDLIASLRKIADSPVGMAYIVDSYGHFMPTDIAELARLFQAHLPGVRIGVHTHNNLQLAYANTMCAAQEGVQMLDSSVFGMGRAAGNCPTELLLHFVQQHTAQQQAQQQAAHTHNYDLRPVLDIIERLFVPLREKEEWGYIMPYTLTGMWNAHPKPAMQLRDCAEKDKYVQFYDEQRPGRPGDVNETGEVQGAPTVQGRA